MSVTVGRNAKYPEERTGSDPIAWQKSAEGVVIRDVGRASEAPQGRKTRRTDRPDRQRRTKARTSGVACRNRDS